MEVVRGAQGFLATHQCGNALDTGRGTEVQGGKQLADCPPPEFETTMDGAPKDDTPTWTAHIITPHTALHSGSKEHKARAPKTTKFHETELDVALPIDRFAPRTADKVARATANSSNQINQGAGPQTALADCPPPQRETE